MNDITVEGVHITNYAPLVEEQKRKLRELSSVLPDSLLSDIEPLPRVKIIPGELPMMTTQAEKLLMNEKVGIFQRAGQLVRIITEAIKPKYTNDIKRPEDALIITSVDAIYLAETLSKLAKWEQYDQRQNEWKPKDCPDKVAKTLLARREWNLPVLAGIIQAPTLRPDGSILEIPGYDKATGLFFNPGQTQFKSIKPYPTKHDALLAIKSLLHLLKEFPFENEESRSVVISGILTSLIRRSIPTAPLHGFTAPKMANGKSLLTDVIGLIANGKVNSVISQSETETEEKKRLLAVLAEGDLIVCYDNIEKPFGSSALCSVLSQTEYKDRVLGSTKNISVPTNALFLATGNNLTFVGDITTRTILCCLNAQCERPEERKFKIDLRSYIPTNRSEFVYSALTILRAYIVAGRPKQPITPFGRFEEWSDLIRSAIVWIGLEDPCKSRKGIENTDPVRLAIKALFAAWFTVFDSTPIKVKTIIDTDSEELKEALSVLLHDGNSNNKGISLGRKLENYNKRIEGGFQLERMPDYQGSATWRVLKIESM